MLLKVRDYMKKYVKYLPLFLFVFIIIFVNVSGVKADTCIPGMPGYPNCNAYNKNNNSGNSSSGSSCIDNCNKSNACMNNDAAACAQCRKKCTASANEDKENWEDPTESFDSDATSNADDATGATSDEAAEKTEQAQDVTEAQKYCNRYEQGTEEWTRCIKNATASPGVYDDLDDGGSIIQAILNWGKSGDSTRYDSGASDPCDLISGEIRTLLHDIFFYISIAGIIILVVMTAISLVKVITASEDEALRNFLKGLWKRIICLIILLLLPTLVTFIIQIVNNVAPGLGIRSDNPLCNVTE